MNQKKRMVITSISAEQDEAGNISGVFVLNQYAVTGEGRSLDPVSEENIDYGVDRVFGHPAAEQVEEVEETPTEE